MNLAGRDIFNAEFFRSDPIKPSTWRRMCARGELPGATQVGQTWRADMDQYRAILTNGPGVANDPVMAEALAIMEQIA